MGAPKARFVERVVNPRTAEAAALVRENGNVVPVLVADLPKTEAIRAAKLVDENLNGRTLNTTSRLADVKAWLRGERDADPAWYEQPAYDDPKPPPMPASSAAYSKGGDAVAPADDAAQLAGLIQRLAGSAVDEVRVREIVAATTLDAGQIRGLVADAVGGLPEMVAERVAEGIKSLRPTVVKIGEREPVEIKGRTHAMFERVLIRVQAGRNVYLTGTPGTGKTTLAEQCAEALGLEFSTISLSPQTSVSRLEGFMNAAGEYVRTAFRERYEHGGVFLADEIDNGHPSTVAFLNQALANGAADFPDGRVKRHAEFRFVAAANTWGNGPTAEHAGRFPLDKATLDRFVMIAVTIDESMERELANDIGGKLADDWCSEVQRVRRNVENAGLKVYVTPRATIDGAHLLAAGVPLNEVSEECLRKGASDDQWRKMIAL